MLGIFTISAVNPLENGYQVDFKGSFTDGKQDDIANYATDGKYYLYLNAFSEAEGKFKVKRFKVLDGRLIGKRSKYPQVDVISEDGTPYQPWASGEGAVGVISEIVTDIGFSPLPVDGDGVSLAFRESARNEDLRLYSNKRNEELATLKTGIEETYAKLDWANEVDRTILEHTDSLANILQAMGLQAQDISDIKSRVQTLEDSVGTINNNIEEINTKVQTLEEHDTDHENRISALETDVEDIKTSVAKIPEIEEKLDENSSEVASLKLSSEAIHNALSEEIMNLRTKVNTNETNIGVLQGQESGLNDNFIEMKNTFNTSMEKLNEFTDSIDGINAKNKEISDNLETINTDITALKAKDVEHDTAISELQTKDNEIVKTIVDLTDEVTSKNTELTGHINAVETKANELETKHDSDIESLTTLISDTKDEIERNVDESLLVVQADLDAIKAKNTEQDTLVSQAILKNNTQENQIKELQSLTSSISTNVKTVEGTLESLTNTDEEIQTSVGALETRVQTLETDLDETKTDYNSHKEYVIKELSDLSTKVTNNTSRLSELDRSITSMQEAVEGELNSYKESSTFEIQALKDLTSRHTTEIDQIKNDLSQVQINISDLEGSTKAVILESEDGIEELGENTFGLLCLGDIEFSDVDYSNILVDITTLKAQNQQLLNRVQTLETENQNLKTKINV